ncbi:MAG: RluA family pseudouridine synthase [Lachnospiraceae bacterium]|nr:RluA family pseudouridine synthase [Lachnospiraceae bacterium]
MSDINSKKYNFIVDADDADVRIDKYLSAACNDLSRSYIQKIITNGGVLLNGEVPKTKTIVNEDDVIEITVPESVIPEIAPEDIPLDILYEDSDVIVVNKPKGIVVHPAAGHYTGTLVNALLYHCKDLSGINGVMRPGIVHRIDMNTTGSLIICKNDFAHNDIAAQLKEHSIKRRYVAIVEGNIKEDEGTIDAPIGRSQKDRKKMAVVMNGKNAVTHFKVLKRSAKYTYVECALETGRTHQIRVHMAHIHHPLLGDDVYGKAVKGLEGQTLHARTLGFVQPHTKEYIEVDAPIPEYFEHILQTF